MTQNNSTSLTRLQFDQYSRQSIVRDLLTATFDDKKLRVLDVGGYLGNTQKFLPNCTVTVLDVYDSDDRHYIKGSALNIPFDDDYFDAVVTFDVFEHIQEKDRELFIAEMVRVSKDVISIAAPFDTDLVADAEVYVDKLHKKLYKKRHPWLVEHIEYGLPNLEKTIQQLKSNKVAFDVFESNNIFLWKMMMGFMMICGDSRLSKLNSEMNKFYNLHRNELGDSVGPSYRKVLFGRKNNAGLPFDTASQANELDPQVYGMFIDMLTEAQLQIVQDKSLSVTQASAHELKSVIDTYEARIAELNRTAYEKSKEKAVKVVRRIRNVASRG